MFQGSVKGTGYPLHLPVSLHFPSHASQCAITFQLDSTTENMGTYILILYKACATESHWWQAVHLMAQLCICMGKELVGLTTKHSLRWHTTWQSILTGAEGQ